MKKFIHLIYVPFTGLGIKDFRGNEWYKYRTNIFKRYTLQSLKAQTCQDFTLWLSFRAEEKDNPITKEIEDAIKESGVKYILTFDGIMMHDDRGLFHNADLKERMAKSLAELKEKIKFIPATYEKDGALMANTTNTPHEPEWVYQTDLGSDDLLHFEAIRELQYQPPRERGACYYLNGYVYDMENNRLAEWNRETSCSKYTIIYPAETFFDAEKHLKYTEGLVSHEYLPIVFKGLRLPDGRYMAGVHRGNISSGWDNSMRGKQFNDIDKKIILNNFGIK